MKNLSKHFQDLLVIIATLIIVALWLDKEFLLLLASGFAFLVAIFPVLVKYISYFWHGIAKILGFFVSKLILAIIFYFFLIPISVFYKIFSKNRSIHLKKQNTYWIDKNNKNFDFTKLW